MIFGVILAGGRGLRLGGVIKANIEIEGVPLVDRVTTALTNQCDALVLSIGNNAPEAINPKAPLECITDAPGVEVGPVGGLASAVAWAREQDSLPSFILSAAVDTAFFPQDFVARAVPLMQRGVDCVMGAAQDETGDGIQIYPTNCLWRFSAIAALPELITTAQAPHGLRNVIDAGSRALVTYPSLSAHGSFMNVNTPDELERCREAAKKMVVNQLPGVST